MMNKKTHKTPIEPHWIDGVEGIAKRMIKITTNVVMVMAPYNRTERRPTRSIVKYKGTQPRAKMIFCIPASSEISEGVAPLLPRIMLPEWWRYSISNIQTMLCYPDTEAHLTQLNTNFR
jgi:hypothetical protein